jgi:antitoxin component of MazEF toxin-antitoxin module
LKLQKNKTRAIEGKEYYKWVIVVPPEQIEELHWDEGEELESFVKNDQLRIRLMTKTSKENEKMNYEQFKQIIKEELLTEPSGLTWTEIKSRRPELYQKLPNNLWVRTLEREIGLVRNKIGTKTIWKLKN